MSRYTLGPALLLAAINLLFPVLATAGTGAIADGKVEMSAVFAYREEDPESWRPLFEEASRLLFNATNGQLQLGKVRLFDAGVRRRDADIWILNGHYGAFANPLGLGASGHIYLSQTHKSVSGLALGQFGLVHEFGHYGFGLYDEYKAAPLPGYVEGPGEQVWLSQPNQFCTTELDPVASIMDGGSTVVPNNRRTEFCTAVDGGLSTAHNDGVLVDGIWYINAQETLNHESCWETIARTCGLVPPTVVDVEDPPGLEPVTVQLIPNLDRLSILIDNSMSMFERPERIELAKQIAEGLVTLLHERKTITIEDEEVTLPGENAGVITFAFDQSTVAPLREIVDAAAKDSVKALIDRIDRTPGPVIYETDMGSGLLAALRQLTGQGNSPACSEAIAILSDGCNNVGSDPCEVIQDLRDRGVRVYSVAVGGDASGDLMKTLADSTGGAFYRAATDEEVSEIAVDMDAQLRDAGVMQAVEDSTAGWDEHLPYMIDMFAEEFTITLQWDIGLLDMTLTSPTGDLISIESADWRQDVEAGRIGDLIYIRVSNPEAGEWIANVIPVEVPDMIHFRVEVDDENRTISVTPSTDRQIYDYPAPVHLSVEVIAEVPVAGASVTARVDRPVGIPDLITLFDDGQAAHGDAWADDGVYNTIWHSYTANGTYTFNIRVENEDGSGPDPDLPWVEDGPGPPPVVPPFVREAEIAVQLEGLSIEICATHVFAPRTIDAGDREGEVTDYLELPSPYRVEDVDFSTISLNGAVQPIPGSGTIGDQDNDGIADLLMRFSRAAVIDALPDGVPTQVRLTARLAGGEPVEADDAIAVIDPEGVEVQIPDGVLWNGSPVEIRWPAAEGTPVRYSGYLTVDGQMTWTQIFEGIEDTSFLWNVSGTETDSAEILVQADTPEGVVSGWTSRVFEIRGEASDATGSPARTAFLGASPNPMAGSTTLRYSLAQSGPTTIEIYDVSGRLVRKLVVEGSAGVHEANWNGTDSDGRRVPSGVYMYIFRAGSHHASGRLMLIQ